jgi:hypothetical protein
MKLVVLDQLVSLFQIQKLRYRIGCLDWKWLSNLARSSSLFISDSWLEVAWIGNGF